MTADRACDAFRLWFAQMKIKELKSSFNSEFSLIYELCDYILSNSQKPSLVPPSSPGTAVAITHLARTHTYLVRSAP